MRAGAAVGLLLLAPVAGGLSQETDPASFTAAAVTGPIHFLRADRGPTFSGSRVVATGDLYVPLLGPCDWANGCAWNDYVAGIRRLVSLVPPDAVILPGHGPASSAAELREFAGLLEGVTSGVRRAIAAGRTREQVVAGGLPAGYSGWAGRGIAADFFLGNAYDALHGRPGAE